MAEFFLTFGQRLAMLRKEKGMKQSQLAKSIGTSYQSISNWENGVSAPNFTLLVTLADALEVSLDYLVGRSDNPKRR